MMNTVLLKRKSTNRKDRKNPFFELDKTPVHSRILVSDEPSESHIELTRNRDFLDGHSDIFDLLAYENGGSDS